MGKKLVLMAVVVATPIVIGMLNAPEVRGQSTTLKSRPNPQFEVASVKAIAPGGPCCKNQVDQQGFASTTTLYNFVATAYRLKVCATKRAGGADCALISGMPPWTTRDVFEIQATMPKNSPGYTQSDLLLGNAPQLELMLQALLADRFKLRVHRETRVMPVYALTLGKNGPKLKKSAGPMLRKGPDGSTFRDQGLEQIGARSPGSGPGMAMSFKDSSMQRFAEGLAGFLDRPVVDRTGIQGDFDFKIEFEIDRNAPTAGDTMVGRMIAGPGMFTAIQEQLGLKLEPAKNPVEVLVIDHVEKPSPN